MGVLRRDLQAAEQQLYAPVELAEVYVAEAQGLEEIGVIGILADELLQVDAGLVELAGGEELEGSEEGGAVMRRSILIMEGATSIIIVSRHGSPLLIFWFQLGHVFSDMEIAGL